MKKHHKQIEFFHGPQRFKFALAGRRGGKTWAIVQDILYTLHSAPAKSKIYYVGPTNPHAKEIIWEPLEEALRANRWKYKSRVSQGRFLLPRKRQIYIMGAENIDRIRGKAAIKIYLDEIAFYKRSLSEVKKAVNPTLTDYKGGLWATTTPNGKGTEAYDMYLECLDNPEWGVFSWKTIDNPYIDPEEIERQKRELDEKSFKQEYEAEWMSFEGLAYYNFDENTHIKVQPPLDFHEPIHMCLDFNVNPTTILLSQKDGDMLRYKKEYSFNDSSTIITTKAFCEDFKEHAKHIKIKIRGDASGKNRSSNTGKSDYHYIFELLDEYGFDYKYEVKASNPPVVDRVNVVNGWLQPLVGPHRVEIDPSCKELIRDLSSQERIGRLLSDKNNLGHKADACGYDIFYEHLLTRKKRTQTREI